MTENVHQFLYKERHRERENKSNAYNKLRRVYLIYSHTYFCTLRKVFYFCIYILFLNSPILISNIFAMMAPPLVMSPEEHFK